MSIIAPCSISDFNNIRVDSIICSCLSKKEGLVRKILDIVKTSVGNRLSVLCKIIVSKCHIVASLDIYNNLSSCSAKICIQSCVLCRVIVIKNNLSVCTTLCVCCLCVHKEVLRSALYLKTGKVEQLISLLHIHELLISLHCLEFRL